MGSTWVLSSQFSSCKEQLGNQNKSCVFFHAGAQKSVLNWRDTKQSIFWCAAHPHPANPALGPRRCGCFSKGGGCDLTGWVTDIIPQNIPQFGMIWSCEGLREKEKKIYFSFPPNITGYWPNPPEQSSIFPQGLMLSLKKVLFWILVFKTVLGTPKIPVLVLGPVSCLCLEEGIFFHQG